MDLVADKRALRGKETASGHPPIRPRGRRTALEMSQDRAQNEKFLHACSQAIMVVYADNVVDACRRSSPCSIRGGECQYFEAVSSVCNCEAARRLLLSQPADTCDGNL